MKLWQSKKESYKNIRLLKLKSNWYTRSTSWYKNVKFKIFSFCPFRCNIQLVLIGFEAFNGSLHLRVWNHVFLWNYA